MYGYTATLKNDPRLTREERLFLCCLNLYLGRPDSGEEAGGILSEGPLDWKSFKRITGYHDSAVILYLVLRRYSGSVDPWFMRVLKNTYIQNTIRNKRFLGTFLQLFRASAARGIELVPIKGMALLSDIYGDHSARSMADIDLMVRKDDLAASEAVLQESGYKKELMGFKEEYWKERQYHIAFHEKRPHRGSPLVELHWALDYKRKEPVLPDLWSRLREAAIEGQKIRILSPEDRLFCLALHNRRYGKVLCLKNIIDLALLLKKYDSFDWDYVLKEAKRGKMMATVLFILSQVRACFGSGAPDSIERSFKVSFSKRRAINNFIKKHTIAVSRTENGDKGAGTGLNRIFLKSHFLLFDSLLEPIRYIINIPLEQFAKYYGFSAYAGRTRFIYRNRLLYMPLRFLFRR